MNRKNQIAAKLRILRHKCLEAGTAADHDIRDFVAI